MFKDNERRLKITKFFGSASRLCLDVLKFYNSDTDNGCYIVLYEEGKLYNYSDGRIYVLEKLYGSWSEKVLSKLYRKAEKIVDGLPYSIICCQTKGSYNDVLEKWKIGQDDSIISEKAESLLDVDDLDQHEIFGLIADWDPDGTTKSYWYVLCRKGCITDENEPMWIVVYGNNQYPTTKEYGEQRVRKILDRAGVSSRISYPNYTYDDIYEIKEKNGNVLIL